MAGRVLAVAPGVRHQLQAHGLICVIFVEPESVIGRSLVQHLFSELPLVAIRHADFDEQITGLSQALDGRLSREQILERARAAVHALVPGALRQPHDRRIDAIIDYAASHIDGHLSLEQAASAASVHLSSSRLRHLFVEQTGLAFKTYMLWLRLVRAVQLYSEGVSLTEAAHGAGFADSAHFSRAFKRTFGAPATTLTRL